MNTKGESILLRALAGVLLVGILFNGARLFALVSDERELDVLQSDGATADERLRGLLALQTERLSNAQRTRRGHLQHELISKALLEGLSVTTENGAVARLGDERPTGVSGAVASLRLRLDRASAAASILETVRIRDRVADFTREGVAVVEIPVEGRTLVRPTFEGEDFSVSDDRLTFTLAQDARPPRVAFTSDGSTATVRDGDRLDLRAGEALQLRVDDESRLREVSWVLTRDGRDAERVTAELDADSTTPAWPIDYGGEILHETSATLSVMAVDTAGNITEESVDLARWKYPPPRLAGVWIDGISADRELITNRATVVASIAVNELHPVTALEVVLADVATALAIGDDERHAATLKLAEEVSELAFVAVSDGWRTEIARATVRLDVTPPRISLLDAEGAPLVLDDVQVGEGANLEVHVSDDVALRPDGVDVGRKGRIGLSSPTVADDAYRRPVRIDEDSMLTVTAVDAAGNEARRAMRFTVRPTLPPDDGRGPAINVRHRDVELSVTTESVFLGDTAHIEIEVVDDAGVSGVEVAGGTVTPPSDGSDTWSVAADGPLSITAVDSHGNSTTRRYPLTLVREAPRVTRIDEVRVPEGEAIIQLTASPKAFRFVTPDRPPEGLVTARLESPDGARVDVETGSGGGSFPAGLDGGTWHLVLALTTLTGIHEVDRVSFAVTRPTGPVLAATLAGKVVPAGSPVSLASLDELLITGPASARIQMVFEGAPLKVRRESDGWRAGNPLRSATGGKLLVRGTSDAGATSEIVFHVSATPYRLTSALAERLSRGEGRLATGDLAGAEAIAAEVEQKVAAALASRLDRSRGVELSKLDGLRRAIAQARVDTATPRTPAGGEPRGGGGDVSSLPVSLTNDRDGAKLLLVTAGGRPFYLYETEVTLEMFRRFLDATLGDKEFWAGRGLSGRALGVFRERMRAVFVKSDDKKTWPVRDMQGDWAEAYAAWAAEGVTSPAGTLRLPTVEEWTRAATGGNETAYPTTGGFADGSDVGQNQNRAAANWNTRNPRPVGWYQPGAYGLRDMAGNVIEICRGRAGDDAYHLAGGSYLNRRKTDLSIAAVKPYVGSKTEPRTIGFRLLFETR